MTSQGVLMTIPWKQKKTRILFTKITKTTKTRTVPKHLSFLMNFKVKYKGNCKMINKFRLFILYTNNTNSVPYPINTNTKSSKTLM